MGRDSPTTDGQQLCSHTCFRGSGAAKHISRTYIYNKRMYERNHKHSCASSEGRIYFKKLFSERAAVPEQGKRTHIYIALTQDAATTAAGIWYRITTTDTYVYCSGRC